MKKSVHLRNVNRTVIPLINTEAGVTPRGRHSAMSIWKRLRLWWAMRCARTKQGHDRVVVGIVTDKAIYYRSIPKQKLLDLLEVQDLYKRKQQLWEQSDSYAIVASSQVEATIIVTRPNDRIYEEGSWDALRHLKRLK